MLKFFFLCIFIFLTSCNKPTTQNTSSSTSSTSSTNNYSKNKNIIDNKIDIKMKREDVISLLGEPDKREVNMYPMGTVEQLFYEPQYTIYISKGKVTKVTGSEAFDKKEAEKSFQRLLVHVKKHRDNGLSDKEVKERILSSPLKILYNSEMIDKALKVK